MPYTIFYSWQSGLPNTTNRGFIEKALEDAVKAIKADESIKIEAVVSRDTQGVPGAPDIAKTIFNKIASADVMAADVSIVTGHEGRPAPNPNVLFELGYALSALGDERLLLIFNTAYGKVEQLPFDLRMRRTITYEMPESTTDRAYERKRLQAKLEYALRGMLTGAQQKAKQRVKILNGDGTPEPLLITGSYASAVDNSKRVLYGALTFTSYTQFPVQITPVRLIVDGQDWFAHQMFFQPMNMGSPPRYKSVTVLAGQSTQYKLNFMFPINSSPDKRAGTLVFRIEDEECSYSVQFG